MPLGRVWSRKLAARTDLAKYDCYFLTGVSRGLGLRERSKRDSSTSQADSFADERGEKASACFGRNDYWEQVLAMSASGRNADEPIGICEIQKERFLRYAGRLVRGRTRGKASACSGRNDRWEQVLAMSAFPSQRPKPTDWRLRNSDREVIEHRGKLDLA
jgi:hypothetical protein